jgi:hypothetical protein
MENETNEQNSTTGSKKLPVYKCKVGAVEAAVWEQDGKDNRKFYGITVARNYKDGETWKTTTSFGTNDLPKLQLALAECYKWIMITSKKSE